MIPFPGMTRRTKMLNKMKLAPKLALVIGSVLSLVLIVLISITAVMSKSAISASTYSELAAISETNGLEIQQIFDAAETSGSQY